MKGHCSVILPYSENILDTLRVKWLFTNSRIFLTRNMKWGQNSICLFSRTNSEKSAGSRFGLISKQSQILDQITAQFLDKEFLIFTLIWILLSLTRNTGFFVQAHKRWTKTKFKDEKNQVTSYQQSIMGTLQQTKFSVTISKTCECPTFILIPGLEICVHWNRTFHDRQGLSGSLNCIQKGSWFHKWLV